MVDINNYPFNCRFLYRDAVRDATAFTASTEAAGHPVENIQDPRQKYTWRSTNDSSEYFTVTFADNETPINQVVLVNHNFPADVGYTTCTIRIRLYNTVPTAIFDETTFVRNYGSMPAAAQERIENTLHSRVDTYHLTDDGSTYDAASMRIDLQTATGTGDGYMEVGAVMAGAYFEPKYNFSYENIPIYPIDDSKQTFSEGGQVYIDATPRRREIELGFSKLDSEDMFIGRADMNYNSWIDMLYVAGKRNVVFVDPYPTNLFIAGTSNNGIATKYLSQIYGVFTSLPGLNRADTENGRMEGSIVVREAL